MSPRTSFNSPTLLRWLARLSDLDVADARPVFAERLSEWLGWSDAILLADALGGGPAGGAAGAPAHPRPPEGSEAAECAALRVALAAAISAASAPSAPRSSRSSGAGRNEPVSADPADFTPHRRHLQTRQRAMDVAIAPLRARLRATLTARSAALAQLAAVDAVMEQVLAERAQRLLSSLPGLLERHFERLRLAAPTPGGSAAPPGGGNTLRRAAWQDQFDRDLQDVLLAELDFRMQPLEGLVAALLPR